MIYMISAYIKQLQLTDNEQVYNNLVLIKPIMYIMSNRNMSVLCVYVPGVCSTQSMNR